MSSTVLMECLCCWLMEDTCMLQKNCLASGNYVATRQVTLHTTGLEHCVFVTFSPWTTERVVKDVALAFAQMSEGIGAA